MSETSDIYASIELMPPHWALASRQLVNWGSYDGYHVFEPSTAGNDTVTLLTGQSESGKSTLVDAQVSLLYPANAAFNKASNAGRSDRSDYSYLLGLRGIRNNNGHDEPVYLRGRSGTGSRTRYGVRSSTTMSTPPTAARYGLPSSCICLRTARRRAW